MSIEHYHMLPTLIQWGSEYLKIMELFGQQTICYSDANNSLDIKPWVE